jgi:hypothetical protein
MLLFGKTDSSEQALKMVRPHVPLAAGFVLITLAASPMAQAHKPSFEVTSVKPNPVLRCRLSDRRGCSRCGRRCACSFKMPISSFRRARWSEGRAG